MAKRLISIVLMLTLVLTPLTAFAGAAETDSEIEELVQQQYEAFAASKDFSGADERALWDMVLHALSGRGEKLVFDNNSAMTAVMLNSEMYKATVSEALAVAVTQMEWFTMDEMTLHGNAGWYDYQMRHQWVAYDEYGNHRGSVLKDSVFTGTLNDNDVAMILVQNTGSEGGYRVYGDGGNMRALNFAMNTKLL